MQPGNSSYNISMEPGLPSDHVRKSSRLAHYDYSTAGAYFITVCCSDMRSIFGSVNGSEVELNAIGRLVSDELSLVHKHHKALTDTYIVMPNHWHAIIFIDPMMHVESLRDSELLLPAQEAHEQMLRPLPVLMNRLKRAMTLGIRQSLRNPQFEVFQRGYYEHIVRDDEDLATRRNYILTNPVRWSLKRQG